MSTIYLCVIIFQPFCVSSFHSFVSNHISLSICTCMCLHHFTHKTCQDKFIYLFTFPVEFFSTSKKEGRKCIYPVFIHASTCIIYLFSFFLQWFTVRACIMSWFYLSVLDFPIRMTKGIYIIFFRKLQVKRVSYQLLLFISREVFVNPKTGKFFRPGERIRPKKFCETLKIIAKNGGNCLYNGSLAKVFVSDIQEMGGIITEEDMASYRYSKLTHSNDTVLFVKLVVNWLVRSFPTLILPKGLSLYSQKPTNETYT